MASPRRGSVKNLEVWRAISRWVGYVLPLVGLVYISYDIDWNQLGVDMVSIGWLWLIAGVALTMVGFFFEALQWKYLLAGNIRISVRMALGSVYAGQFANEVLPMRVGELFRGYLIADWTNRPFLDTVSAALALRVLDGFWLAVGVWATAFFVFLPRVLLIGASFLVLFILLGSSTLAYGLVYHKDALIKWQADKKVLGILALGLRDIAVKSPLYLSQAAALLFLALQILAFWSLLFAYGIDLSFSVAAAVFLIVTLGVLLPNTPGNIGLYQFFCVLGLTYFGIPKTTAAGLSFVAYFFLKVPVWSIGFAVLTWTGIPLRSFEKKMKGLWWK